jgi:hypothetical protein
LGEREPLGGGEGVEDGELQKKRGEGQGVSAAPEFEGADLVGEARVADDADLFVHVGVEGGVAAELPEGVAGGIGAAEGGDEVHFDVVEANAEGDVAELGETVDQVAGEGLVEGVERGGDGGGKAEEEVDVGVLGVEGVVAEGGAFGVGAGEGNGFEVGSGPVAQEGSQAAEELVGEAGVEAMGEEGQEKEFVRRQKNTAFGRLDAGGGEEDSSQKSKIKSQKSKVGMAGRGCQVSGVSKGVDNVQCL